MGPRAPDWTLLESLDPGELEEEDVEKVTNYNLGVKIYLYFEFIDL